MIIQQYLGLRSALIIPTILMFKYEASLSLLSKRGIDV